ncbi:MAG: hypothetical protein AB8F95_21785 [Bacteroidia bacterium]
MSSLQATLHNLDKDWEEKDSRVLKAKTSRKNLLACLLVFFPTLLLLPVIIENEAVLFELGRLILIAAVVNGLFMYFEKEAFIRKSPYGKAKARYESERQAILHQIDQAEDS